MINLWTLYEESFLLDNYSKEGVVFCSKELERTTSSVANKAKRMGLCVEKPFVRRTKSHTEYETELFEREIDVIPLEEYVNARTPILHECFEGHTWKVSPNKILTNTGGCPQCSALRWNPDKPAILYLLSFTVADTLYYIVGITNKEPKVVFKDNWNTYNMKLEWSIFFDSGEDAYSAEQKVLQEYSASLIDTGVLKLGNTKTLSVYIPKENIK